MIHAQMASFPARAGIVMQTVASILPQVDRLRICLNGCPEVPPALRDHPKIEVLLPDRDLKDAGKFAFRVAPDDLVFTIDDDIIYPPDYVRHTIAMLERLDPDRDIVGYMGNAWVDKPDGRKGWRNYMFHKRLAHIFKADILGTGTACQTGRNLPDLDQIAPAAGFVDLRHARWHAGAGRRMWVLPRPEGWLVNNLPPDMWQDSLFTTVNRAGHPAMRAELALVIAERLPGSGMRLEKLARSGR